MIHLLPVNPELHRNLFKEWVASERIKKWWGDPIAREDQFNVTSNSQHAIIAKNHIAVGYIRWETVDLDALAEIGLQGVPEGSVDMDIFIGDVERAERGAGPAALELVFEQLRRTTKVPLVGLCTSVDNTIAHRAFEKANCVRWRQYVDEQFGPCWVYIRQLGQTKLG